MAIGGIGSWGRAKDISWSAARIDWGDPKETLSEGPGEKSYRTAKGGFSRSKDQYKQFWDEDRKSWGVFKPEEVPEPPPTPAPAAEETQGVGESRSLLKRRGRRSTQVVKRERQPLGGGGALT